MVTFPTFSSNEGFDFIYKGILQQLRQKFPTDNIEYNDSAHINSTRYTPTAAFGGISNLSIVNTDTNKCVIVSFADIEEIYTYSMHGWEPYNIVHIFGSMRWGNDCVTTEQIQDKFKFKYTTFQYPIPHMAYNSYAIANRKPYDLNNRIKKAFFCGVQHPYRATILEHLRRHPLVEILDVRDKFDYFDLMNQYAILISLNGNGELTIRDFEGMGFGIPVIRSELMSQRYNPLLPNIHYIRGSVPSTAAWMVYPGYTSKQIAEQFIDRIETTIVDEEFLKTISLNGIDYYTNFCTYPYIINLFMQLFDRSILL